LPFGFLPRGINAGPAEFVDGVAPRTPQIIRLDETTITVGDRAATGVEGRVKTLTGIVQVEPA
jgi:hypothetical protein